MEVVAPEPAEPPTKTCGICGEEHEVCSTLQIRHYVCDTQVPSKARLSLPTGLRVEKMAAEGTSSVIAVDRIEEGTRFGPFEARRQFSLCPSVDFVLKVFKTDDEYFDEFYLDTSDENQCNWMCFVQPASNADEQNLVCYEHESNVYYASTRTIEVGEHLRVWYSPYYGKLMGKEALASVTEVEADRPVDFDVNALVKKQQGVMDRKVWICKFCGKQEDDVTSFATHIYEHYALQMRKTCEVCNDTFKTRQSLKKHIYFVHPKEPYARTPILQEKNEQDVPKILERPNDAVVIGGPLLNKTLPEPLENGNLLEEVLENLDIEGQANSIMDLQIDGLLSDVDGFNLNVPENEDKFVCDVCLKPFDTLKFLMKHLPGHMGKYTCSNCQTVFCRKENLSSHSCLGSPVKCTECDKSFQLKKYLRRHMATQHGTRYECRDGCKKLFTSERALKEHVCPPQSSVAHVCNLCNKEFSKARNLRRHMLVHSARNDNMEYVCDVCSYKFHTKKQFMQHMKTHREPEFTCKDCDKKFHRRATFLEHMEIHRNNPSHVCKVCDQKFAVKKYLTQHMLKHNEEYRHDCPECPQKFKQKTNMTTHVNRSHRRKCPSCDESFVSNELLRKHSVIHYERCYECPVCKHIVKLKSSLLRHLKNKHADRTFDVSEIGRYEKRAREDVDNNNAGDDIVNLLNLKDKVDTMDANLDYIVNDYDTSNLIDTNFNENTRNRNLDDNVLDFNSLEMEFEKNISTAQQPQGVEDREVCLSMPELGSMDQSITLAENAYLLENGTIVEPREQGKVVLYIFDQNKVT